jgi:hypothetical protein
MAKKKGKHVMTGEAAFYRICFAGEAEMGRARRAN